MRANFRAVAGPMTGKEFVVRSNELVQVGRTEWADVAFPGDARMSSVHFCVETELDACYIKDADSTNGTFLNGKKLKQRQVLQDGDEVIAGDTSFKVQIAGNGPGTAADGKAAKGAALPPGSPWGKTDSPQQKKMRAQLASKDPLPYTSEQCASGLTLCRGKIAKTPVSDVAVRMSKNHAAHLIVDFRRLGQTPPPELRKVEFLFDWFEPQVAEIASPVLVSEGDYPTWPCLIDEGWGKDAVACFFSNRETAEIWAYFRRVCRAKGHGDAAPSAVLGFCWPSVLVALLSHSPTYSSLLFDGIDAILTEFPDLPETWQLYGGQNLPGILDELGFEREEEEKDGATG